MSDTVGGGAWGLGQARAALDRGLWEEARVAFETALAAGERPEALEGLGWALFWLDRVGESLDVRERAFRLYLESGAVRDAARVAYELGVDCIDLRGEAPASGWLERARRLLDGLETGAEHGWLALWEGHVALMTRREAATARERASQALELSRRFGLADLELLCRALEGLVLVAEGRVDPGMRQLDEATAAALAGEMSTLNAVGMTCCLLVHACERVRDYDRAAQWAQRVERFSRHWGIGPALTVCRTQHAAMLIGHGDWAEAERELTAATEQLAASRPLLVVEGREQLAELRRRQGRWDEAEELFGLVEGRSLALLGRAAIALDRGDSAAAADLLQRFLRRTPPDNWNGRARGLELLVRAHVALGQSAQAEAALRELAGLVSQVQSPTIRGALLVAEGAILTSEARFEEARQRLEDAVDLLLSARAPHEAARTRLDLALCLARLDRRGPARQEARSALESLQRLGAARDAARAEELLTELSSEDTPAAPRPKARLNEAGLTSREVEVLRLVAEGLGDKDIADRLFLSQHTVHRHISNIRTKLGLPSRAAAVGWAAKNGIL
jgi:ATP/maltotriose-dependent transcriptional regulator MalT